MMAYQSRAGREPWLLPNTDDTFVELARAGLRHIMVICPGFVTDCLETIDEIGYVGLQQFQAAGGETLQLVACLNDRPQWIAAMSRDRARAAPGLVIGDCPQMGWSVLNWNTGANWS